MVQVKGQPPGLPAAKVTYDAEIRFQAPTHKPGFSTKVEAHRRSAVRGVAPDTRRDRLRRTLRVDSRSILTFKEPVCPERVHHRQSPATPLPRDHRTGRF